MKVISLSCAMAGAAPATASSDTAINRLFFVTSNSPLLRARSLWNAWLFPAGSRPAPGLLLDRPGGEAGDEVALQEHDDDHDRQDSDETGCHQLVPLHFLLS